jgi:glycosyltransferase involved in cell wall biosynthesis
VKLATVGSVNPQKGIDDLVECAQIVQDKCECKVHFFVVGPIYESQRKYGVKIKIRVESKGLNVHVLGRRDDVERILKSSDIYVCSSRSEASPTVVWEAMAMGLPIVSTDVGDVAQFLEGDSRCGYVVPTNRPAELADSICSLITDSQKREKFSKRAREVAISELDLDLCVRRHANAYRDLVSRRH